MHLQTDAFLRLLRQFCSSQPPSRQTSGIYKRIAVKNHMDVWRTYLGYRICIGLKYFILDADSSGSNRRILQIDLA
jgi:hypothetical protein